AVSTNSEGDRLGAANAGLNVTIKKMNKYSCEGQKGVYFTVGGGNITNSILDIENASKTCEVEICNKEVQKVEIIGDTSDKYDQLEKIKKLLNEGILTQEEYDTEKKKILEQEK